MNQISWISGLFFLSLIINPSFTTNTPSLLEGPDKKNFQDFVAVFEQASFPLEITMEDLKEEAYEDLSNDDYHALEKQSRSRNLGWELRDYIPGRSPRYGRIPPDEYEPYALLANNDDYVALIVAGKRAFSVSPSYYKLITYTPKGEVISEFRLAGRSGMYRYQTATIDEDFNITFVKHRLSNKGNIETYKSEEDTCTILATGKIFPEFEGEGMKIIPPKFKKKKKSDYKNAKASIF